MRFLRDSTFLTWVVIVALLGGLLLLARGLGETGEIAAPPGTTSGSVVGAKNSEAAVVVEELRGLAPHGVAAGTDPGALAAWGTRISQTATRGAQLRAEEGASVADPLYATFTAIGLSAENLAAASGDAVAAPSLRTSILLGIDRAANIAAGLPVPDSVAGLIGGVSTPKELVAPTAPANGSAPPIPTPTPGANHGHPTPNLDISPPTPGELTR